MVKEITSKISSITSQLGTPPALVPNAGASNKVNELTPVTLTPMPKAEVKVDFERDSQELKLAIGKLNDMLTSNARNVSFAMDEKLGRPIVYVKNATTGEVVRQIPNEVVVRIAHSIADFKGMLHNKKI